MVNSLAYLLSTKLDNAALSMCILSELPVCESKNVKSIDSPLTRFSCRLFEYVRCVTAHLVIKRLLEESSFLCRATDICSAIDSDFEGTF